MQLNYRLDGFSMLKRVPDKRLKIALKNDNNALELFLKCVCYFYFVDESQINIGTFVKDENNIDDLEYLLDEQKVYSKIAGYLALYYLFDDIENHDVDNLINFNTADEKQVSEVNLEEKTGEEEPTMNEIYESLASTDENEVEETNTMYFGYIKVVSSLNNTKDFYNFYPTHYLRNGELEEITDPNILFPDRGNLLFSTKDWRSDVLADYFSDNTCCIADIRDEDLRENRNSATNYLNSTNLKVIYEDIKDRVFAPREKKFYYIIEPNQNGELDFSKNIEVKGFDFSDRDDCLLLYGDCLVGPFHVKINQKTGNNEIEISAEKNFIFDRYICNTDHIEDYFFKIKNGYSAEGDLNVRIVKIDERFAKEEHDYITNKALLDKLERILEIYSQSGESIDSLDIDRIKKIYMDSSFCVKGNLQLSEDRFKRITYILDNWKLSSETVKEVTNITEKLLMIACNNNDAAFSEVVNILAENDAVIREIPKHQAIKESTEQLLAEADVLRKEIEKLEKDKESIKQEEIEKIKKEIENLESKRQQLSDELKNLELNYSDLKEYDQLTNKLSALREEIDAQDKYYTILLRKKSDLQNEIIKSVNDAFNPEKISISIADAIKNDMLSQAIIDATATVAKEKDNLQYEKRVKAINAYGHCNKLCGDELLNDIVSKVKRHRPAYDEEDILNLLICITQGFLTVFSGEPGTGKTSICNILGNVLGLDNICTHIEQWDGNIIDANRYISVSVERGWTTKRDLIGYYNPLTKTFDQSDKNIYNALKLLSKENKSSKFPMLILLDEANLSSMEYYWADFMALCDGTGDGKICVGDNEILNIPDTLRFVATINNDHTTETLSPRLIDRAWVITLPSCETGKANKFTPEDYDTVLWENLRDVLKPDKELSPRIKSVLNELCSKFEIANMPISPRTDMAVRTYCQIAQNVFKGEMAFTNAVDFAVSQKLLTKINNYGSSFVRGSNKKTFSEWLSELQSYFDEKEMKRCKDIIERIRNYGEAMDYYKFF